MDTHIFLEISEVGIIKNIQFFANNPILLHINPTKLHFIKILFMPKYFGNYYFYFDQFLIQKADKLPTLIFKQHTV